MIFIPVESLVNGFVGLAVIFLVMYAFFCGFLILHDFAGQDKERRQCSRYASSFKYLAILFIILFIAAGVSASFIPLEGYY